MKLKVVPTVIDVEVVRGTDNSFEATIKDGAGVIIDISNDKVEMVVKDRPGGAEKMKKTNPSGTHSDPTNGKTQFTFTKAEMEPSGTSDDRDLNWHYSIRRETSADQEQVHITGKFDILRTSSQEIV